MKVAKFGGSSVADAKQIKKISTIILDDPTRKFVIVSAPGKRHENDFKMTDILILLAETYNNQDVFENYLDIIIKRFSEIITDLNLPSTLIHEIKDTIISTISSDLPYVRKLDAIKALGEDCNAKVISTYLESIGVNATYMNPKDAGIVVSNEPGNAQILQESFQSLYELREHHCDVLVIPGFFGYSKEGHIVTFSRGGSDITGAIVAAGVQANLYENFTDVDSVFTVNPNIVNNPKEIKTLTYKEMRELSYAGFSVFHDEALIPAFRRSIPVAIKNTNNPSLPGTLVVSEKQKQENCVVGIASDTGFCTLYVGKYLMNRELGFGRKLFHILENESVSFEHTPSGIDDMSVIIREHQLTPEKEAKIMKKIKEELKADTVSIHHNLAIIMIVGEGIMNTIGIAKKATTALTDAGVNINMINQGSSDVSMMFGINAEDIDSAIQSLYHEFFEN
ncbi:aspartate kinase [Ornithinibacillus halophilus]|uniref:aspartate kinase n=1 Tax=Ornithinibacillus halophilus TaxID=930117 RepID=UPI00093273C9|nr:aspartate kinase [Ornithinibacillus halophilus]